jgi:hypothetical protein
MNKTFRRLAPALLILIFACVATADDFRSETIASGQPCSSCPIHVHPGQFMVVRNFTQEDGSTRGTVMVSKPPNSAPVNALSAAIVDPTNPPEFINSVIIAGPAQVTIQCGTTLGNCFVSFKKD